MVDVGVGRRREPSSWGSDAPGTRRVSRRRPSAVLRACSAGPMAWSLAVGAASRGGTVSHEAAAVGGAGAPAPVGAMGAAEVGAEAGVAGSICPGAAGAAGWNPALTVGPVTSGEPMPRSGVFGAKLAGLMSAGDLGVKLAGLISEEPLPDSGAVGAAGAQAPGSGAGTAEAIETPWSIEESQEGFAGPVPVGAAVDGSLSNGLLVSFWVTIGSQASGAAGAALKEPLEPAGFGGATSAAQSKGAIVGAAVASLALVAWAAASSSSVSP